MSDFAHTYGPWAVIAGASEGIGAAFATALAARNCKLVLIARRLPELEAFAATLRTETLCLSLDMASDFSAALLAACSGREVGLAIYNAAFAPEGPFAQAALPDLQRSIAVNCFAPVAFAHAFAAAMQQRGRGGLILMSSLAGFQGSPGIAVYGATKAFNLVLGEALWKELAASGVRVLACCAGAVLTPSYIRSGRGRAPGQLEPETVAEETLRALEHGPLIIPGLFNRLASFVMRRLLPRRTAVSIMAAQSDMRP